jgi:Fic family protein
LYVAAPPDTDAILRTLPGERFFEILPATAQQDGSEYLHWDKLRHLEPPEGLSHAEWWLGIKMSRNALRRSMPLTDSEGRAFAYSSVPDSIFRQLHRVDQECSGSIAMAEVVTADEHARQHYLVNSLMEEAIRSSQLEGAVTTRRVAKELLRSGRPPKDRSEHMILNNYRGLQYIREAIGDQLTPGAVLELQRILTDGTLDNPDAAGRLQRPDEDRVAVYDRRDGSLLHQPPPADQLPARLAAMCNFANGTDNPDLFIHPVIRAILLHFWLAYDHPFEDGNGRTARALFYWSMRTQGYWLVEYLSISTILRKAPAQYARSFLLTETDDRDTTYFIEYQLEVIRRAVEALHAYLRRKVREIRDVERLIKGSRDFNHRQLALLSNAIRNPDQTYTFQSHATSHGVTHETARTDLQGLVARGFLEQRRLGRRYVFTPSPDLPEQAKRVA